MSLFDTPAGPATVRLVVAYDGTGFRGFAKQAAQPRTRTVGGALGSAIEKVLRHPVDLTCAGRTDAGVHARQQVVSFEADPGLDPWRLQTALNSMLGPEIVVVSADLVEPGFDARRAATARTYMYTIVNRPTPDPFLARYAWWVSEPLDIRLLRLGADVFVGEHDFASFCRKGRAPGSSTVRRVQTSRWHDEGEGVLRYEIRSGAFCWQMVRSIVGTLVEVGMGKRRPGELLEVIRAVDRSAAAQPAPPHGLCLWAVDY
ncbi:MAG: tRNA pseudouridine38-40 synthase [Actinomycetota bacterium]|nr:tRNA pseudouridine38-40 synthase [Actinomycetota bacterium]